jgi:hypothetical protein
LSFFASAVALTSVSGEVFAPRTISSSCMTLAGAKKCRPTTCSGRLVAARDLVDVERRGVRSQDRVALDGAVELRAKTSFFTAIDSNTASITMSTSAIARVVAHELDGLGALLGLVGRQLALLGLTLVGVGDVLLAAFDLLGFTSITETGMPAFANTIAMPVPIVPAPTTAADLISLAFDRSAREPGILPSSRSAKKRWIAACAGALDDELREQPRFARDAELVLEIRSRFDRVDQLVRREAALVFGRHHAVRDRDHRRRHDDLQRADAILRAGLFLCELDRAREQTSPSTISSRIPIALGLLGVLGLRPRASSAAPSARRRSSSGSSSRASAAGAASRRPREEAQQNLGQADL